MRTPALHLLVALGAGALLLLASPGLRADEPPRPPNIVLILADDLGWRDVGFMGGDFYATPHLDAFAKQGLVFTDCYANGPNCAPSRAALLSGQYGPRTGMYTVGSPDRGRPRDRKLLTVPNRRRLAPQVITLAEVLKARGYATASIGKWHLGEGAADGPEAHGFDVNAGGTLRGAPRSYLSPYRNPALRDGERGEHLTTRLTNEAIAFVKANAAKPFFLYLPFFAVHTPIQPEPERAKKYTDRRPGILHQNPRFGALVEGMDANIGRLLAAIDTAGLRGDTLVVFTSDNGGSSGQTRMTPLRGAKGMLYEGGIRVPCAVRWPDRIPAGKRRSTPMIGVDLYPTLAAAAGAPLSADQPLDGVNLLPHWQGGPAPDRSALFWHFPAYLEGGRALGIGRFRTRPVGAIRKGRYKLLEFFEDNRLELYDLEQDASEGQNLASAMPERASALRAELAAWRKAVGATVPDQPNPAYRPRSRPVRPRQPDKPNIIYILADDLGYGEVGCYGQTKIRTPHIDRLGKEGLRFTQHYSGSPVCAPSRCVLMTGLHTGRAYVRGNRGRPVLGQQPIPAGTRTLARLLRQQGYATACVGKWGLGGPGSSGVPWRQGFDLFFGYLDQWRAHSHYPTYLYRNGLPVTLDNPFFKAHQRLKEAPLDPRAFEQYSGPDYAPDRMIEEALAFVTEHKQEPFFLFYATPVPHVAIQVPDEALDAYPESWDPKPYLGQKGYVPHPRPRAGYAAMVTRMDEHIGRLLARLEALGLADNTLVLFSSDNGPTFAGGADSAFFESAGPLRGLKQSVYEGGIRVPFIARWPGRIEPGTESDHVSAFQDLLPTVAEIVGAAAPEDVDGISFLPTLVGREGQRRHEALYWELGRSQAVRAGDLKLVRKTNRAGKTSAELYNLADDLGETTNLADARPEDLARLIELARSLRRPSRVYTSVYDDGR